MAATDPFVLNADGTAKDPVAFREALKADPAKMEALEKEPDVAAIVLGEDVSAFQELIKSIYQARGKGFWAAGMARRAVGGVVANTPPPAEGDRTLCAAAAPCSHPFNLRLPVKPVPLCRPRRSASKSTTRGWRSARSMRSA